MLRLALLGSGATCLSVGATVGYACYDRSFRATLESMVPASSGVFSALLGDDFIPVSAPKLQKTLPANITPPPIIEQEPSPVTPVPSEPLTPELKAEIPSVPEDTISISKVESSEPTPEVSAPPAPPPPESRPSLQALCNAALSSVHEAISTQQRAMIAVSDHAELVWQSMSDENISVTQIEVTQSSFLKNQLCESAEDMAKIARLNLHALSEAIDRAEAESGPSDSASLIVAKQTLAKARSTLQTARRTRRAAEEERDSSRADSGENLTTERGALQLEYNRQMRVYQEELDGQLRQQLRRQIAAHCDHLKDELAAQRAELERIHKSEVEDRLHEQRLVLDASRADMLGQVEGLRQALQERVHLDSVALYSHRMWTACQWFHDTVVNLTLANHGANSDDCRIPICEHVRLLKKTADSADRLVNAVLDSLPEAVLSSGVVSQPELQRRFLHLEKVCRRVALIGDKGGSLYKYAVSFLQSFLVLDAYTPTANSQYSEVISDRLDTFGLLARAKEAMRRGDLDLAVRYVGQLEGEPLRAASDWLTDSRQLLEVRQAAEALMAHVGADGISATAGVQ